MRQILHLRKLNKEKVLTDEEYQTAIYSYFMGMDSDQFIDTIYSLIIYNIFIQVVCQTLNGINKNDV